MKLTREHNPEAIRRHGHIKPARRGAPRCATPFPGTARACSLERGHRGPHVAHGRLGRVLAVWDSAVRPHATATPARRPDSPARQRASADVDAGLTSPVRKLLDTLTGVAPSMETAFFLLLFVAMVGFVIDWALRIAGLK